jgi:SAM-dependent methyltransferase
MTSNETQDSLAPRDHWEKVWAENPDESPLFNPKRRSFIHLHRLYQRFLPRNSQYRFLEIGCCPGRFMWYFNRYFGYRVSGLEYIDWCAEKTRELLRRERIAAEVTCADFFEYTPPAGSELWDVVGSFGFVEHFQDTAAVVRRHLEFLKPGGYLVLAVPNLRGMYGRLFEILAPKVYRMHRVLSLEDLIEPVTREGEMEVLAAGYYGHLCLGNAWFPDKMKEWGRTIYFLSRAVAFGLENTARILPQIDFLAPHIALIARKRIPAQISIPPREDTTGNPL